MLSLLPPPPAPATLRPCPLSPYQAFASLLLAARQVSARGVAVVSLPSLRAAWVDACRGSDVVLVHDAMSLLGAHVAESLGLPMWRLLTSPGRLLTSAYSVSTGLHTSSLGALNWVQGAAQLAAACLPLLM